MNNGSDATNKFHLSLSLYIYSPWQHAVPLGFGHVHNKLVPTVNKLKGFRFGGTTYNDIYIYTSHARIHSPSTGLVKSR